MSAFAEFMNKVYQFLISPEFQSIVTAAIGVGTSIALISNRVAALKVANATVVTNRQNAQISDLKKDNEVLQAKVDRLENAITQQSAMFSLAFLNSKKLDGNTKQEIARIAANLASPNKLKPEAIESNISDTLDRVAEVAKQVAEAPIAPIVQDAKSIFQKLTKV